MGFNDNHSLGYSLLSYLCGYYRYHFTEQFVAAYMSYASDDDDIATGKQIAERYGIRITRPKFRQDNRDFYIDKQNHAISDALMTIKGIGLKDAEALLTLSGGTYNTFAELLYAIGQTKGALNKTVVETLIKMDYFEEFGGAGKLLKVFKEFTEGKNNLSNKNLKAETVTKRLTALNEYERSLSDEPLPLQVLIPFEVEKFGTVFHTFEDRPAQYVVLDVDEKYSPKVKLYSLKTGKTGLMKVKKALYNENKMSAGDIVTISDWGKMPCCRYENGLRVPIPGQHELWLRNYQITMRCAK